MNKLGKIIRIYRMNKNYKQRYVAECLDINQSTYSRIESGNVFPSLEILYKLSKLLSFSIDKVLEMTFSNQKIYQIQSSNLKNYLFLSLKNHKE